MDMFSYLLGKKKGESEVFDTSDIREVINMTDANITSGTPFTQYPQGLYDGYINVLKDRDVLLDNMNIGDSTGTIEDAADLPVYNYKATKESAQETTTGKNLWGGFIYTRSSNGIDYSYNVNGVIEASGTATSDSYSMIQSEASGKTITLAAGTYTVSGALSNIEVQILNYATNTGIVYTDGNISSTFILTESTEIYLRIKVLNGTNIQNGVSMKIMLEQGSTPTSYEPYTGGIAAPNPDYPETINVVTGDVDINVVGENLFNPNNLEQGWINTSGELSPNTARTRFADYVEVKANEKYYLYSNGITDIENWWVHFYDENKQWLSYYSASDMTNNNNIFTTPNNCKYIKGAIAVQSSTISEGILSESTTATVSLGDNEIAGIGDYKDELIIDKAGHCYINKKIGKVVLNGSESWNYNDGNSLFYLSDFINYKFASFIPLCNYYKGQMSVSSYGNVDNNRITTLNLTGSSRLILKDTSYANTTELETWLSTHNTTVYYVLDEPTLINLHQTVDIELSDGYNYITNNKDMDMEIKYIKNVYN